MSQQIQLRGDTTANWESVNPVLAQREIGVEIIADIPTNIKIGDGVSTWTALPYFASGTGSGTDQIQSDWTQTIDTALDYIKNKPIIPTGAIAPYFEAAVAVSSSVFGITAGMIEDIFYYAGYVTIPSGSTGGINVQYYIDVNTTSHEYILSTTGFITGNVPLYGVSTVDGIITGYSDQRGLIVSGKTVQIQVDWDQTTDTELDFILNKPTIPTGDTTTQTFVTATRIDTTDGAYDAQVKTRLMTITDGAVSLGVESGWTLVENWSTAAC